MDVSPTGANPAEDRSVRTAAALRALREGIGQKLDTHHRQIGDLEASIASRIMLIAEEIAREQLSESQSSIQQNQDQLQKLRSTLFERDTTFAQLQQQIAESLSERNQLEVELKSARATLDLVRGESSSDGERLLAENADLGRQQALALSRVSELELLLESAKQENVRACESWEIETSEKRQQLVELEQKLAEAQGAQCESLQHAEVSRVRSEQLEHEQHIHATKLAEAEARAENLELQHTQQLNSLQEECSQLQRRAERAESEIQGLATEREGLVGERDTLRAERAELQAKLEVLQTTSCDKCSQLRSEVGNLQKNVSEITHQHHAATERLAQTERELGELQEKHSQANSRLREAEENLRHLSDHTKCEDEIAQLGRKFELAMADVQRLKRESTELQEEIARRPEPTGEESPELVSLRTERDELALRVSQLEEATSVRVDEDMQQRLEDLQRRFEMAVDDVRQLKQANSKLQVQLEKAPVQRGATAASEGQDWQSLKARLLASLESEETDTTPTPARLEELVQVEETISITDQVVAEKDREIVRLQTELSSVRANSTDRSAREEAIATLMDQDELVQAERSRLETLQAEWREKLRAAELEISVQRATLARKEAEIQQKLTEMEHATSKASPAADGKPRRRWLSALGLNGEEEGKT